MGSVPERCCPGEGVGAIRACSLGWRRILKELKELPHGDIEIFAQGVDGLQINPRCSLLVQEGDGVSVKPRVTRHVADLELALSHQSGQVTLDQDMLHKKISFKMTKNA